MNETECFTLKNYSYSQFTPLLDILFTNKIYKDILSSDSRIAYSVLLNRVSLSIKNNWTDDNGNVYIIYTREELAEYMNVGYKVVLRAFKELTKSNLINEKRQGMGRPNLIYVYKPKISDMPKRKLFNFFKGNS